MSKYIIGIGAANVDITGKTFNKLIMKDSNPGTMSISIGGVTRNVCENVARLKYPIKLISTLGDDMYGHLIKSYSAAAGINMEECVQVANAQSSTYMAILGDDGDMELALSDMRIIKHFTVEFMMSKLEEVKKAAAVTFDPCLPEDTVAYITKEYSKYVPLFADPVSSAYALRLKPYLQYIHTLKPNSMELAILTDMPTNSEDEIKAACQKAIEIGVKRVFVSLGKDGCLYYDNEGHCVRRKFKPVEKMVNASGAGDSFMAAVLYSYVNNFDINKTVNYALAAGIAAINSETTINAGMSVELLENIIKERGSYEY